jgi:hypothetical protein
LLVSIRPQALQRRLQVQDLQAGALHATPERGHARAIRAHRHADIATARAARLVRDAAVRCDGPQHAVLGTHDVQAACRAQPAQAGGIGINGLDQRVRPLFQQGAHRNARAACQINHERRMTRRRARAPVRKSAQEYSGGCRSP